MEHTSIIMNWLPYNNFFIFIFLNIIYGIALLCVGHALLHKRNPRAALSWIVTILFLPIVGTLMYISFGIGRADSRAAKLMRNAQLMAKNHPEYLQAAEGKLEPIGYIEQANLPIQYQSMSILGKKLTGRSLSEGNSIQLLINGDEAYPAMLDAIRKAKSHVYLTTYIFNGGDISQEFCRALSEAAARNVDVRLLLDGFGARIYSLSWQWKKLPEQGVRVAHFLPPRLFPPNFAINLRNHRKILVADHIGFTGGMNIADYHIQKHPKFHVQDIHFMLSGPIVSQLRESFLLDWGFCTSEYTSLEAREKKKTGDIYCRMVLDGPGSGKDPLHELLYGAIAASTKSINIMTPYFLPTQEFMASLKSAALRGVDVRIILPEKNNLFYVHWATYHLLPTLLDSGVRIYYQPPPFAHTKLLIIDEYYVQIGSANLDSRSLRLNFELNVECFDIDFAKCMETYFMSKMNISRAYTMDDAQKKRLPTRLRNAACWIFSPYL